MRNANTVSLPGRCLVSSDSICMSDGQALDWAAQWGPVGYSTACGFQADVLVCNYPFLGQAGFLPSPSENAVP